MPIIDLNKIQSISLNAINSEEKNSEENKNITLNDSLLNLPENRNSEEIMQGVLIDEPGDSNQETGNRNQYSVHSTQETKHSTQESAHSTQDIENIEKSEYPKTPRTKKSREKSKQDINIQNSFISQANVFLSIKECEVLSGISTVSIRKAIKLKEINYQLQNGKYKIAFLELLKWCYSSTRRKNVLNSLGIGQYVNNWKTTLEN